MKPLFICYPRCITCRKAKKWLEENGIEYDFRNIKENNPSAAEISEWITKSGLPAKKFLNTSGALYKELKLKDKVKEMSEADIINLISTDGLLVKRPVFINDNKILLGFNEQEWADVKVI